MDWFPLWLSLKVALLATIISTLLGLALAWWLAQGNFRGKGLLDAMVTLPLVLPPTVLGYYLLIAIGRNSIFGGMYERITGSPLVFTWQGAVLAAILHSMPLLVKTSRAALEAVDHSYERAARSLGAPEWKVFLQVSLPLARLPVMAAVTLAFARALGDFGVTLMVAGNIPGRTQTVAVAIYDAVEAADGATARTLVLAVSLLALLIVWIAERLNARSATS